MWNYLFECHATDRGSNSLYFPECTQLRSKRGEKLLPFQYGDYKVMRTQRINPRFNCKYGDLHYTPECQRLLKLVKADEESIDRYAQRVVRHEMRRKRESAARARKAGGVTPHQPFDWDHYRTAVLPALQAEQNRWQRQLAENARRNGR